VLRRLSEQRRRIVVAGCLAEHGAIIIGASRPCEHLRDAISRLQVPDAAAAAAPSAARLGEVPQGAAAVGGTHAAPERVHGAARRLVEQGSRMDHADVAEEGADVA
jgi:hypothetical protein